MTYEDFFINMNGEFEDVKKCAPRYAKGALRQHDRGSTGILELLGEKPSLEILNEVA